MAAFGRLGRHSNRSQHALEPQSSSSGSAGRTGATAATEQQVQQQRQQQQQQVQQQHQRQQSQNNQVLLDEADSPAHNASANAASAHAHAHPTATPHSALSSSHNTAFSSSESFDSRQQPPPHHLQQQQQQQQQLSQQQHSQQSLPLHQHLPPQQSQAQTQQQPPPLSSSPSSAGAAPPPPRLYNSPSAASSTTAAINNPPLLQQSPNPNHQGVGTSPIFDGNQPRRDFVDQAALGRSQSIRYSTHLPPQQAYSIATSSVDDLNSAASYGRSHGPGPISSQPQQGQPTQQQAPEKRSTRSRFKGIFGSSHKGAHPDQQQQQQQQQQTQQQQQQQQQGISIGHNHNPSYDNTGGLARRPSKRVSNPPPSLKTSFSHLTHGHSHSSSASHSQSQSQSQSHSRSPSQSQSLSPTHSQPQPATVAGAAAQAQVQTPFQAQAAQTQPQPQNPGLDWQQPQARDAHAHAQAAPYLSQPSPRQGLGDIDEYYSAHESNSHSPSQNSRLSLHNTIRHVSGAADVDPQQQQQQQQAPYDAAAYRQHPAPPQQLQQPPPQPHVQVHPQDQQPPQPHIDTTEYDQPHSPQNPSQQAYAFSNPQQLQQQQQQPINYHQEPRIANAYRGLSSHQQNPETVSQFSHESPITDSDQRSAILQSAHTSPAVNNAVYTQNGGSTLSLPPIQQTTSQPQQSGMAPPAGGPPPSRRNPDADNKPLRSQVDVPGGPPPAYRHSNAPLNTMNPLPPVPGTASGQPPVYRSERPSQFEGQPIDQGRDSPQPSSAVPSDVAEGDKGMKDLLTKYKNVKRLYFDGKSQIEILSGQVEQLQNAVANQRMSQSRTALDDSEYSTRFNRLNGAINNLSFNIRKDWRCVPQWLDKFVSVDALKTGKQEMTAVGRAVISRWLVEEVFNKCFHPGLEPQLSQDLKEIELSIRHNAYTMSSQEELNALTNKVVSWRMTTLEGLHRQLNSPASADSRTSFTNKATTNLTACLYQFLNSPPPAGVEGSTSMIVELAVGIAANLPLESRDVAITYPLPGEIVHPHLMEVEKTPLPVLEAQKDDDDGDSDDEGDKDKNGRGDKAKTALPKDPSRVRFAGFFALEVRGRQVLMKAPVWTL